MIQCSLNHTGLNVRTYRAMIAPRGRRNSKPTINNIACATMYFWYGSNGMPPLDVVGDVDVEFPEPPACAIVNAGFVGSLLPAESV